MNAKRNVKRAVQDELSTIPGATVIVTPMGGVKVKRIAGDFTVFLSSRTQPPLFKHQYPVHP